MSHTGHRHTPYDEMMEWPDDIKIDRASPVAIIDDRQDMKEFLLLVGQQLHHNPEESVQMRIFHFSYPIMLFSGHKYFEKCSRLSFLHGYSFRCKVLARLPTRNTMLTHPQKPDKDRSNTIERNHPLGLIAQHIGQKGAQ